MGGGTPCDIKNNSPRSVIIRYICDPEAYKYGSVSVPRQSQWVWPTIVPSPTSFITISKVTKLFMAVLDKGVWLLSFCHIFSIAWLEKEVALLSINGLDYISTES